jgi:hypothetical protein
LLQTVDAPLGRLHRLSAAGRRDRQRCPDITSKLHWKRPDQRITAVGERLRRLLSIGEDLEQEAGLSCPESQIR